MAFKYSICYPNQEEIEQRTTPISGTEVLKIARTYPWVDQLNLMRTLEREEFYYNPSLEFTSIGNGRSFTLTANFDANKNLEFSLWYNRPKTTKDLFGLLGSSEKMVLDDIWSINFDDALKYLDSFVNGNYQVIENLFEK